MDKCVSVPKAFLFKKANPPKQTNMFVHVIKNKEVLWLLSWAKDL